MNEQAVARKICQHLDQGVDQLSHPVLERLAAARTAALSKVPSRPKPATPAHENPAPLWWRLAATAVPLLVLVAGVFMVDTVEQEQSVAELAEIDSALLTDDLPLVAYADHGFGVYLKNTRR
jgi:hypothetical protein